MAWGTQRGWRWCSKCQGLHYGPHLAQSTCPEGGQHSITAGGSYSLLHSASPLPAHHQANWRWCNKCQGLFWGGGQAQSNCPEGGQHSQTGSGNYALGHQAGVGQAGWRWCSKCQGLFWGAGQAQSNCPEGGTHNIGFSGNYRLPIVTSRVRVHVKVLTQPNLSIELMLQNMREVYALANVDVEWASTETLNLPALNVVSIGGCFMGQTTSEQNQLFNNRNHVASNDVVVYFVQATDPPANGCAAHPAGRPGAVVTKFASQWTFAHEIGHVLGVHHPDQGGPCLLDRLMTSCGTSNITNPPPDLIESERNTMKASALTVNV